MKVTYYQIHRDDGSGIYAFVMPDGRFISITYQSPESAPDALRRAAICATELMEKGYDIVEAYMPKGAENGKIQNIPR